MKILVTGVLMLLVWMGISGYWYTCHIKHLCTERQEEVVPPPPPPPAEKAVVAVKRLSSDHALIHFPFDEVQASDLDMIQDFTLELRAYLQEQPQKKLRLTGHADSKGAADYNYALGMRRAEMVRHYFVGQGLDSTRIEVLSEGESHPLASNDTPEGQKENRVVEVKVVEIK